MQMRCSLLCGIILSAILGLSQLGATDPASADRESQNANAIAEQILAASSSTAERERLIAEHIEQAPGLIAAMTKNLKAGTPEEYDRIPWIWRVSIAAARRNDAKQIHKLMEVAIPQDGDKLHDWQAVVLGGGVINGLSQLGVMPNQRINEILADDKPLAKRWRRGLEASAAMAEDEKVPAGTRYDALRMIAMEGWDRRGEQLAKYLAKGVNEELQMGAVSGLSDINSKPATDALIASLGNLTDNNRNLAWDGLLRTDERAKQVLDAIAAGTIKKAKVPDKVAEKLKTHTSPPIRDSAVRLLGTTK
jgi:hypothetical protein